MEKEKSVRPVSGYLVVLIVLAMLAGAIISLRVGMPVPAIILFVALVITSIGFTIVYPNQSTVLVLFGDYRGTIKHNGFFWVNPLLIRQKISLRARNFDSQPIKVNDKLGNPVLIGVVLVWKVEDTYKAAFEVNDYENFVKIQSEAALRKLAGTYPYDNFDDDEIDITLRAGGNEVNEQLEQSMRKRLDIAGINVMEARINYLAYSAEIAGAMLQRQQATAIVAARLKIVEGAVGMVEMALKELSDKHIIDLDEEKKASMVSNLMVVLCSDKSATPVVNTGTLYS